MSLRSLLDNPGAVEGAPDIVAVKAGTYDVEVRRLIVGEKENEETGEVREYIRYILEIPDVPNASDVTGFLNIPDLDPEQFQRASTGDLSGIPKGAVRDLNKLRRFLECFGLQLNVLATRDDNGNCPGAEGARGRVTLTNREDRRYPGVRENVVNAWTG